MKEKIIDYIERLEAKSLQVDEYFKQRNDLYIENQEKTKEIERLNNIIKTQMYCKYANNCDEIYDCTKEEYNTMCEKNMEMSLEITRLNNIINELEEYLIKKKNSFNVCNANDILYKLKELKEKK